jgi:ParB-like chromosome segregation protein Spo0J
MTTPAKLEPHELSRLFPPISEEDFNKLAADIKLHGLHQPIMRYQDKILDGNNRYRACELLKITPTKFVDFDGDDAAARNYVISANIHRRHLNAEQRREIIATLLKADPSRSDRLIAATAKVDNKTVAAVRGQMEVTEEIPQLETTTGADGKKRKKKDKDTEKKKEYETIKYLKPVDHKTAANAYRVLSDHLLEALDDMQELSGVGHATEYAIGTVSKLNNKIVEMEGPEAEAEMADAAE